MWWLATAIEIGWAINFADLNAAPPDRLLLDFMIIHAS
jgi:hypothetical protein